MSANPITVPQLVDANTNTPIQGLDGARGRSFSPVFNGPGTYRFTLPLNDKAAGLVKKRRTGVLLTRNGRDIWSGGVTSAIKSAAANSLQVTATGWLEEFDKRYVRKDEEAALSFSSVIGGEIIHALVDAVNAQQDTDGNVRPLRMTFGTASDTEPRTTRFQAGSAYGSSMMSMVTIEDGCDLQIDHLARTISTVPPDSFAIRSNVRFGYGIAPFNLSDAIETNDGESLFNRESVALANGNVVVADDQVGINDAGVMLEEWTSLSDENDPTIGLAFANAELVYKRFGIITYQITPKEFGDLPRPYDDFEWGDVGYLSVDKDSFQVRDQAIRLFAGTLTYDENGNETLSELQLALS